MDPSPDGHLALREAEIRIICMGRINSRLQAYPVARADRGAGARFGIGARLARRVRACE
jgi:hypothetical protein